MLLIDTRDHRPDPPPEREPITIPLRAALRVLRSQWAFVAAVVFLVASLLIPGWPGLLPLWVSMYFVFYWLTHLYHGNDGLSHYHQ